MEGFCKRSRGSAAMFLKRRPHACSFVSHKVFLKLFCKSKFPHKSVNLFFISVTVNDKSAILWGGSLQQNDFKHTLCVVYKVSVHAGCGGLRALKPSSLPSGGRAPYSGRDCVKSLRSSCTGLYPQMPAGPRAAGCVAA